MFVMTESTPNPSTLKFLPPVTVLDKGVAEFGSTEAAAVSPLARRLFAIEGVKGVLLGNDFVSVTRRDGEDWQALRTLVIAAIVDHFSSGDPVLAEGATSAEPAPGEPDSEIVSQIKELLDSRVRPAVAQDGGDIVFHSFEDGVVYLTMRGACSGCPSSSATLKAGIENMLRHYIPEVVEVRSIL
jgi:Fe-S cluster biogenesis protein NfuA